MASCARKIIFPIWFLVAPLFYDGTSEQVEKISRHTSFSSSTTTVNSTSTFLQQSIHPQSKHSNPIRVCIVGTEWRHSWCLKERLETLTSSKRRETLNYTRWVLCLSLTVSCWRMHGWGTLRSFFRGITVRGITKLSPISINPSFIHSLQCWCFP